MHTRGSQKPAVGRNKNIKHVEKEAPVDAGAF